MLLLKFISSSVSVSCLLLSAEPSHALSSSTTSGKRPYSVWMADSIISRGQAIDFPNSGSGIFLQVGIFQAALQEVMKSPAAHYAQENWRGFLKRSSESIISRLLNASQDTTYPLDRSSIGRALLPQYEQNENKTYKEALDALRTSIDLQAKNQFGGYWYYVYPNWSYLDGMYSLVPFYSLYTSHFDSENTTNVNDDIVHQLDLLYSHCFDNSTGLLHHGYDASKTAVWANPITGSSSIVWSRAMGWYFMSLIDFLSATPIPHHSTTFKQILHLFISLSQAIIAAVDEKTGCWWQVVNFPGRAGNYIESSGSAMFTYALYKGARLGFLNDSVVQVASRAYEYLVHEFVVREGNGTLSWNGTVAICSLNSTASYEYYVGQPISFNSVLGSAAFVLASLEHEMHEGAC